jgi:hypothetical protein
MVVILWLFSFAAAVFGLRWSIIPETRRFGAALIASSLAIASSYVGLSWLHFDASKTINGHVEWSFNSKWFFLTSLLLGAASLGLALWHNRKSAKTPLPTA